MLHRPLILSLEPRLLLSSAQPADSLLPSTTVSGIVFSDTVKKNGQPDPGEGIANCIVTFNNNLDHTVATPTTAADGSYSAVLEPGTYDVTIVGPTVDNTEVNKNFVVGVTNQTANFQVSTGSDDSGGGTTGSTHTDLAVNISALPSVITPGTKAIPVTVSVVNKGDAYSGAVTAKVYFSADRVADTTDPQTPTASANIKIGKNTSHAFSFNTAPILALLPQGKYFVIAKITAAGDTNAADNTLVSKQITVTRPAAPTAVLVPSLTGKLAVTGKTLPFSLAINNTGAADAVGSISLTLSARPAKGADIPITSVPPIQFKAKSKGAAFKLTRTLALASLPAGSYKLVISATFSLTSPRLQTLKDTLVTSAFTVK